MSEETPPKAELGILFIHGIGSQRRGDTLLQCGGAIHEWLREWLSRGPFGDPEWKLDLSDTLLAPDDGPAYGRLVLSRGDTRHTWMLAESCWGEVVRPPTYGEFVRWAFHIVPFAAILHLAPRFRRAWHLWQRIEETERQGWMSFATLRELEFELQRRRATDVPRTAAVTRAETARVGLRMVRRAVGSGLLLGPLALLSLVVQIFLAAVMLLALLPVGFLRSFANSVQRTLTAVIGDSYLFLQRPLTGAAVATYVQRDLQWLASRCEHVAIVAHSQGAALTYRLVDRLSRLGRRPANLDLLVTYGSGLRKLFDLERAAREPARWTFYGAIALSLSLAATALGVHAAIHVERALPAIAGIAICSVLLSSLLLAASGALDRSRKGTAAPPLDPALLDVEWQDLYASRDPVPNGPLAVCTPDAGPPDAAADEAAKAVDKSHDQARVEAFRDQQREVVNLASPLSDHNTYWSSMDDFVGRVVTRLARVAGLRVEALFDADWLDLSAARRRWRVRLLEGCRNVSILAAFAILYWGLHLPSRAILERVGALVPALPGRVKRLFAELLDWLPSVVMEPWFVGAAVVLASIFAMSAVANAGWRAWDRRERATFFARAPYRTSAGFYVFALGWLGMTVVAFAVVNWAGTMPRELLRSSWWMPTVLWLVTGVVLLRLGPRPGTARECGRVALARGQALMERVLSGHTEDLRDAGGCFTISRQWLQGLQPSDDFVQAALGEATVLELCRDRLPGALDEEIASYERALDALRRMGRDTADVTRKQQAAQAALAARATSQERGTSSAA